MLLLLALLPPAPVTPTRSASTTWTVATIRDTASSIQPFTITTSLVIMGPNTNALTITGNGYTPTFWLLGTGTAVTISHLTISSGGGIDFTGFAPGALTLTGSQVTGNSFAVVGP